MKKTIVITESQYNFMRNLTGRVRKGDIVLKEQNGVDANLPGNGVRIAFLFVSFKK